MYFQIFVRISFILLYSNLLNVFQHMLVFLVHISVSYGIAAYLFYLLYLLTFLGLGPRPIDDEGPAQARLVAALWPRPGSPCTRMKVNGRTSNKRKHDGIMHAHEDSRSSPFPAASLMS